MKSKVAAKTGGLTYQWEIMQALGLEDEEIKKYDLVHAYCTLFLLSSVTCVCAFISMGARVGAVQSGENAYLSPMWQGFIPYAMSCVNGVCWFSVQFWETF